MANRTKRLISSAAIMLLCLFYCGEGLGQQSGIVFHTSFEIDSSRYCEYTQYNGQICSTCYFENFFNNIFTANNSPDIYSACDTIINYYFNNPLNSVGYQFPHSGNNYVGLCSNSTGFHPPINSYNLREWIGIRLTNKLKPNKFYRVEYYVSPADSDFQVSISPQIYFNADSIRFPFSFASTNYDTIDYSKVVYADSNLYTNTNEWYKISGIYHADGTEQYLYLGNFFNDEQTPISPLNITSPFISIQEWPYYYIDDITVYELDSTYIGIEENKINNKVTVYPNPANDILTINTGNINNIQMELFDISGRKLFQQKLSASIENIDVSALSNGVYILSIISNNQIVKREKVIISR